MKSLNKRQNIFLRNEFPLIGSCKARFAFAGIDARFLQTLLPDRLTLAEQNYTEPGKHPVLFMFEQTHLESDFSRHPSRSILDTLEQDVKHLLKLDYNEFIVMLPFVKFKEGVTVEKNLFCYLPVLLLDSVLAVLGGRVFWDFNKRLASFDITQREYAVNTIIFSDPILKGNFLIEGEPIKAVENENFKRLMPILELPVVEEGSGLYSTCIYKINYQDAYITPVSSQIENFNCQYLPRNLRISVPNILQQVMGSFDINYDWSLSYLEIINP
jgi:hypothetical protein